MDHSLFEFDPGEEMGDEEFHEGSSRSPIPVSPLSTEDQFRTLSLTQGAEDDSQTDDVITNAIVIGKGKGVSRPLPISAPSRSQAHDIFDTHSDPQSPSEPSSSSITSPTSIGCAEFFPTIEDPAYGPEAYSTSPFDDEKHNIGWKTEDHTIPPTLPPLQFSPTEFGYGRMEWPSSGYAGSPPGPSSYGSGFASIVEPTPTQDPIPLVSIPDVSSILRRMPSRRRSFSNLSVRSDKSITLHSISRLKTKVGGSALSLKLFKKRGSGPNSTSPPPTSHGLTDPCLEEIEPGSCFLPWRGDAKYLCNTSSIDPVIQLPQSSSGAFNRSALRHRGRSKSSPLSFSPLDIIPVVPITLTEPVPVVIRNYFDEYLPKELKLEIFAGLVSLHETTYQKRILNGTWTLAVATSSKNKIVGRDKGIRELIKLGRVSKSWRSLVMDGQLWARLDLHAFPKIPMSLVLDLTRNAGPFIKGLELAGHAHLLSSTLIGIADNLRERTLNPGLPGYTQLSTINLRGCTALTARSLHHLLEWCPMLENLNVKGLSIVTNTTCDILSFACPRLKSLDMSRCPNVDGTGIRSWCEKLLVKGEQLVMKNLRLSGFKEIDDETMAYLGRASPYLEVLDLSCVSDLHNSAVEAFISCEDGDESGDTILLTSRQIGRDPSDPTLYKRRLTQLRHLSLSSCPLLTDIACSNLAYTMPNLEFLELAGIGAELKDEGLIQLLQTTPFIRRLDLEDASDVTDDLLAAITPDTDSQTPDGSLAVPGHSLEQLILSYAGNITDDALIALIRGCKQLKVIEVDNTRISGTVVREFVQLSRERKLSNARIAVIDCRGIGETLVRDISKSTRPRHGWKAYAARKLGYFDEKDGEDLKMAQDECDPLRVVLKSFYSWQTVDTVSAAREKKRKSGAARRAANESTGSVSEGEETLVTGGRTRWWSPSGRSGNTSPAMDNQDREGCIIM